MRLIDADEAYKILTDYYHQRTEIQHKALKEAIERVPTVDAEPVVRCKDCVHNQLPPTSGNADCELWYGMTNTYGYCHYGERREDAEIY